jgi:hypothetical protein
MYLTAAWAAGTSELLSMEADRPSVMYPTFTGVPVAGLAGPNTEAAAVVVVVVLATAAEPPLDVGVPDVLLDADLVLLQAASTVALTATHTSAVRPDFRM